MFTRLQGCFSDCFAFVRTGSAPDLAVKQLNFPEAPWPPESFLLLVRAVFYASTIGKPFNRQIKPFQPFWPNCCCPTQHSQALPCRFRSNQTPFSALLTRLILRTNAVFFDARTDPAFGRGAFISCYRRRSRAADCRSGYFSWITGLTPSRIPCC